MGLFQPHGRYRRRDGQAALTAIVIHGHADAAALLDAASEPLWLATAPQASAYLGAPLCRALRDQLAGEFGDRFAGLIYDCGDRAADVLSALRHGLKHLLIDAALDSENLQALARLYEAELAVRNGGFRSGLPK